MNESGRKVDESSWKEINNRMMIQKRKIIENDTTELKVELTKEIKKEIIAFANTKGGKIYIGIDDDGNILGIKNVNKNIEALSGMIREGIKSDLTLYTRIYSEVLENKTILVIEVLEAPNKPYYLAEKGLKSSGVFMRYGNTSAPVSGEIIKKMIQERQNTLFEIMPSRNQRLTFEYMRRVFNECHLSTNKNKYKTLNIINLERIDITDYPEYALRESLLNAIIHRDYNYSGSILISLYDNRFEITSLGGLVKGLSISDLYLGVSESRNPYLASIFYRLKYVENFGTGINRILDSYQDFDKKPKFIDSDNAFKVILYNKKYQEEKTDSNVSQEEMIIEYLKKNGRMERIDIEQILNVSKTRAYNLLRQMLDDRIIESKGSGVNRYYVLK